MSIERRNPYRQVVVHFLSCGHTYWTGITGTNPRELEIPDQVRCSVCGADAAVMAWGLQDVTPKAAFPG